MVSPLRMGAVCLGEDDYYVDDDDNEDFENKDGEDAVVSPFWRIGAA